MAAMMNMNNLLNGKDSRWLQLEVCREFQRNKCSRQDTECKFAHPPANVEVQNGKVTACYDSIKGRCNREKPPCKYFHPPQHLKDQLLINGRNHLALKNALMQQMGIAPGQPVMPGQVPAVDIQNGTSVPPLGFSMTVGTQPFMATNPYLTGIPASTYSPYFAPGHLVPALLGPDPSGVGSQLGPVVQQAVPVAQQKIPRSDRLEVCREFMRGACKRAESECRFAHPQESVTTHEDGSVTVCMDAVKGRCARDSCRYFHPPLHLQAQIKAAQSRATATTPVSAAAAAVAAAAAAAASSMTHPIQTPAGPAPSNASNAASAAGHHPLEIGKKRAAESDMFQLMDMKTVGSFYYENIAFSGMVPYKRPAAEKSGIPVYQPGATTYQQLMQLQQPFVPVSSSSNIPPNAAYVIYTDTNGQLLDTLPVCQDFNRSLCSRLNCRFVHLMESDKVEVCDQRVAVCRDHANGQCKRKQCKYYHIPIVLPPANVMATIFKTETTTNTTNNNGIAQGITTTAAAAAASPASKIINNSNQVTASSANTPATTHNHVISSQSFTAPSVSNTAAFLPSSASLSTALTTTAATTPAISSAIAPPSALVNQQSSAAATAAALAMLFNSNPALVASINSAAVHDPSSFINNNNNATANSGVSNNLTNLAFLNLNTATTALANNPFLSPTTWTLENLQQFQQAAAAAAAIQTAHTTNHQNLLTAANTLENCNNFLAPSATHRKFLNTTNSSSAIIKKNIFYTNKNNNLLASVTTAPATVPTAANNNNNFSIVSTTTI